ncbi:patatin-like phospholipase family protein [Undibacterium sp.]|jgi:NTE family protein|uniref:patatin-like phospholipase family protein n=1 Tax=Undibacterium sp. TaxID=1914977 RepID=UPI002D18B420|nr:patatin-like phospholipase family protein [Undibacterium sp.]HTD05041.1 patatin-like phospholipase family protein [Undibacterium sp.]
MAVDANHVAGTRPRKSKPSSVTADTSAATALPGQVVLVLQGGGALGAYQVGVYEALHEAGIEPDWVIGTSIGAINGAIIAGNPPAQRLQRLRQFWQLTEHHSSHFSGSCNALINMLTVTQGIPGFFALNPASWLGFNANTGIEQASYYSTAPLRKTLEALVDFDYLNGRHMRLTVGAVNARCGEMRYFDSRDERIAAEHVMASGALPPAFPAVRIDGEPYWDGGLYSNTPIEAVLDDRPRRDSVIFSVQLWNPQGPESASLTQVIGKVKDIQYASRSSHIERQRQIHRLRHVIRELTLKLPAELRNDPECRELSAWGCGTTMHIVTLKAPVLAGEDHTKDIDFTAKGISARWQAGLEDTRRMLASRPWTAVVDPIEGVMIHEGK